tara:strand:+ start:1376 stop:1510 length:135 start_codon:yes stop_codon:yes gene_type:complete
MNRVPKQNIIRRSVLIKPSPANNKAIKVGHSSKKVPMGLSSLVK